jgi:hypothetical protein
MNSRNRLLWLLFFAFTFRASVCLALPPSFKLGSIDLLRELIVKDVVKRNLFKDSDHCYISIRSSTSKAERTLLAKLVNVSPAVEILDHPLAFYSQKEIMSIINSNVIVSLPDNKEFIRDRVRQPKNPSEQEAIKGLVVPILGPHMAGSWWLYNFGKHDEAWSITKVEHLKGKKQRHPLK